MDLQTQGKSLILYSQHSSTTRLVVYVLNSKKNKTCLPAKRIKTEYLNSKLKKKRFNL